MIDLGKGVPMLDADDPKFASKLEFALWSVGGASDYSNDRERPYNGQPHTDHGERGKTEVKGLTMRDVADCIVQGFLAASCDAELQNRTVEIKEEFVGTEYACNGSWRYQDVYKAKEDIDPLAMVQNTMCFIEHMMGIYPNVEKLSTATPSDSERG